MTRETSLAPREVQAEMLEMTIDLMRIEHRLKHLSDQLPKPDATHDRLPNSVAEAIDGAAQGRLLEEAIEHFRMVANATESQLRRDHLRFGLHLGAPVAAFRAIAGGGGDDRPAAPGEEAP